MTQPTNPETEHQAIRLQVDALRDADPRTPIGVHLGTSQIASIIAYVRQVSGQAEVGPVLSFQGLEVRSSKKPDHIALLWTETDDPDPVDTAPAVEALPVATPPAEAAPSNG